MARFVPPITQLMNSDGSDVGSGWQLFFYDTGTTDAKDTFSDSALTTANANPVVADSAGRFGDIFLETGTYRVILKDADDTEIWDADPVDGSTGNSGAVRSITESDTLTVSDSTKVIAVDASGGAVTVTLLAAATAGDGFEVIVKKVDSSASAVTIDGNGAETIDGAATMILPNQYDTAQLRCDASAWHSIGKDVGGFGRAFVWAKGSDIASASPLVLGTDGNYFDVTGTTGFAAITVRAGTLFMLQFDGALTLTHGATLDLPGEADITTAAGDRLIAFAEAANTVQVLSYFKADGTVIAGNATQADQETGTSTIKPVTPGRQQYHPSAVNVWAVISWSAGTPGDDASYNVDSLDDTTTGTVDVNFTTAFSSANYAAVAQLSDTADISVQSLCYTELRLAGSVTCIVGTSASPSDTHPVSLMCSGDQ